MRIEFEILRGESNGLICVRGWGASLDSIRFDFDPVRSARKRNLVLIEKALARWVGQNTSLAPSVAFLLTEARSYLGLTLHVPYLGTR